eukprot:4570276-Pyramimonas_sp.AAC.1
MRPLGTSRKWLDTGVVALWDSARWELEALQNIIPLIRRDFGASWSSKVVASDAPLRGYGVASRDLPRDVVHQLGRVNEHWRFSGLAHIKFRQG